MRQQVLASLAVSALACYICPAQNASYFRMFPPEFRPSDISYDGITVVGKQFNQAAMWTEATGVVLLGFLPGETGSAATAVSGNGTFIAGVSGEESFRWSAATGMISLGPEWSSARGVSDDGQVIIGTLWGQQTSQAFRWTPAAGIVGLGWLPGPSFPYSWGTGVSRDGTIAVTPSYSSCAINGYEPAIWTEGRGMEGLGGLPGSTWCDGFAFSISPDGTAVSGWADSSAHLGTRAYRWTQSTGMVDLGRIYEASGTNGALSDRGEVIVGDTLTETDPVYIWDAAGGLRSLKETLEHEHGLNLSGVTLRRARGISADGKTIVGITDTFGGWIAHLGDGACYADCDKSTGNGVLDVFDFLCFQNSFVNAEPYACDCDTTTGAGVCDVFDFLCFQNAFVGGCP